MYTIPLDGDFHMVYYRSDLLKKDGLNPPATWDDYMTIAQKYNGQDLNGDGEPDYGSCIAKKKGAQSYWWIISIAAGLLQAKGTDEGAFFDTATWTRCWVTTRRCPRPSRCMRRPRPSGRRMS